MEYSNARMERVNNGYIVSWDEMEKSSQEGMYSPMSYHKKQEVFTEKQHKEAMACLDKYSMGNKNGKENSSHMKGKEY